MDGTVQGAMSPNAKTALVLAAVAAAFFIGVLIRHWQW
jgi:hypothetical protein